MITENLNFTVRLIRLQGFCGLLLGALLLNGCRSKIVNVQTPDGEPVPNALIAAYQQDIFPFNGERMFKTGKNGQAVIPFSGLVCLYAGKKGYCLEYAGVSEANSRIILIPYNAAAYEASRLSHLISDKYKIPPEKLWLEWVEYINWLEKKRAGPGI